MSDFDGGFVLARTDCGVAPIVDRVVRDYLTRVGEEHAGRNLVYVSERGAKALWIAIVGGPADGKGEGGGSREEPPSQWNDHLVPFP
jgi:hypothetical protein